ncbi:oligoendopeptidase F [Mycoplasma marinum]|uniref:Oligopeptidase F n=1 Tax=Mycoplasma marinum TaxID=1937190 RepID=A0A4R0XXU5_9MOLU|nr:oligoendopeptidase F [Mycoplasma marinum]TCG11867.1 oligoendopeptidase F [Mycoplasma marinum]
MSQAKEYKKYEDVEKKYTWDLETILEGKTYECWFELAVEKFKNIIKNKDVKFKTEKKYLSSLKDDDEFGMIMNKIQNYLMNNFNKNISDPKSKQMLEKFEFEMFKLEKEFGSEVNRMFQNEKNLLKWAEKPAFANYKKSILGTLEQKKHKLSNEVETFLTESSRAKISAASTFAIITDSELDYGYATSSKGKKIKITSANRAKLMKHSDEKVRKSTMKNYSKGYLNHKQSLSNLLFQHFKEVTVMSKMRKYDSAVLSQISGDKADEKLLETLYGAVQENKDVFKKYNAAKKRFFKAKFNKTYKKWDTSLPLVKVKSEYTVEEAKEMILEALKPMGEKYNAVVKEAFNDRWIDYMSVKNKRSGAYSIGGSYGLSKKYILMNWNGELRSVSTLAHEMGHSMHSYLSDEKQPYSLSAYPIFLAEIASIFNELMLKDHLLKTSTNDELKFDLLESAITSFDGTIMRQAMWSNYEFDLLRAIEEGKPMSSYESISKLYYENARKYSTKSNEKFKADEQWASIMVPHYYYGFYMYKYAIGYTVATVFFQRYKKDGVVALQNYIDEFLSAGARDWPIQILKDAGIDLYDKNIYKEAFNSLETFIDEYIKIGNKIFKK